MEFGVSTFVTDEGIGPAALGRALEERGFESLFVAEHSHIPVSRETPLPEGGELPRKYYRTLDPFVVLSAAATATERLVLGTGIALLVERDPIMTAKEAASVDRVSGGRFVLGVGSGWNREEMRNHGTDPATRVSLLGERVKAIKRIWTEDEAEFHGDFVDFDPIYAWPKPVRRPHLPVLVGGEGRTVLDRVLDYGDGWFPRWKGEAEPLVSAIAEFRERCAREGREQLPVTVFGVPETREAIAAAAGLDAERVLVNLPTEPEDETLKRLDDIAVMIDEAR
ncbi:putative F420-dependent oxidoreductase [Spinactinospora alkalitolerans]|uniref:Putative F420-dependent oxidoreductase n=1 Tax=Spinactinospora alkalitolerans TaxID=687207 RepID=A0A852U8F9_9ACTN|nr:LLM class F420-dependent oxidoreductase [Spinactinospora alkalitolerans]NYE50364.1 putative F420-dependent oxidoreductase [Spinactinospora alkalitolerans]